MRLADNPALSAAAATRRPVIPLWVLAPDDEEGGWPLVGAARYWQHHALNNLQHSLASMGSGLVLRDGRAAGAEAGQGTLLTLLMLCQETGATDVYWCACYEPWRHSRDLRIASALRECGVAPHELRGSTLYAPWDARPDQKSASMGFGSVGFFLNACRDLGEPPPPLPPPSSLPPPPRWPASLALSALGLGHLPRRGSASQGAQGAHVDWAVGIRQFWAAGEEAALAALEGFIRDGIRSFEGRQRHRADQRNTAVISPYLRFGELSPRTVIQRVTEALGRRAPPTFLRRLAWRDLAYWALWRFPSLPDVGFRPHYDRQPWEADEAPFEAWCGARTGYPLVDAAMTQLWAVGWIPNYMRHVVAGFLVEFLNVDWRKGERWFSETLVDADTAINAYMWQNGGHSGMDQWNFVMHPVFAAKSCDPEGEYVRRWVPQLAKLPLEYIHCPWEAPFAMRAACKLVLGGERGNYPARIVTDLEAARRRSHEAVMSVRKGEGKRFILPSGHEWLDLGGGQRAVLITRQDFREGAILTRQTAEAKWDVRRRNRDDLLSLAVRDSEREHHTSHL
jgi:deoxyribodipyrimidine photo-lyase